MWVDVCSEGIITLSKFFFCETAQEDPEIFTQVTFNRSETSLVLNRQSSHSGTGRRGVSSLVLPPPLFRIPSERQIRLSLFSQALIGFWARR